ncbi:capsule polysaccharide export protein KpsC/LpsZ [Neobacillus cucumis]|nr:capsule polysaccharide export protein KpsC/LpsZ [Neobacillus cucumis]
MAILHKRLKPKLETEKTIAFLLGFSKWKHSFIQDYLNQYDVVFIDDKESMLSIINKAEKYKEKVIMVWGYKERSGLLQFAKKNNIPLYRIEDGFIRSVQLGASKSIPISLVMDSQALYYDASQPSDLEDILNTYDFQSDKDLINRAVNCINILKEQNISKYNNVSSKNIEAVYGHKEKKRILVIGQVEDDESIKRGSSRPITNNELVILAAMENPEAEIIYKPHPDVLFGKRAMQSNPAEVAHIAKVITEPLGLTDSFQTIDHVYTITSLSGFEALLRGISVTTFGAPFYSGWGLTDDRQKVDRRNQQLTIEEIFAAAYILYPKYMHPITRRMITIEEALSFIGIMKKQEENKQHAYHVKSELLHPESVIKNEVGGKIGILSKGIQAIPNLDSFFLSELEFNPYEETESLTYIAGWGMKQSANKAIALAEKYNIPYVGLEDGFLRSVGLGVDGAPPLSISVDNVGIYYDATRPSRLENILNASGWEREDLLQDAKKSMELIRVNYLSKYNHAPIIDSAKFLDAGKQRVLVVDQTLGDMSITLGLADKERFKEMYEAAVKENPNADIFIKTHPDVISGKKEGNLTPRNVGKNAVFIYDDCNPLSLVEQFDKVYVVTSQLGFEALMLGKEVHCFGMPFYAGWGITSDRLKIDRRKRARNLEEIFAAAYLLYCRYLNPTTNQLGTIFDVINYLTENKNND